MVGRTTQRKTTSLSCPICGARVNYKRGDPLPPAFPFCSVRCKMVDLHNWLTEQYVVGRELSHEEREEIEPEEMSREDLLSLVRDLQSRMQTSADGEDESDETESIDA